MSIRIRSPVVEMYVNEDDALPVVLEFREKSGEKGQVLMTLSELVGLEKQLSMSIDELGLEREELLKDIVISVVKKETEKEKL